MTDITRIGPASGTVTECLEELEKQGLSRNKAAAQIGVSGATLGLWLRGKYTGDVAEVDAKVSRWLHTRREAERHSLEAAGLDVHRNLAVTEEVGAVLAHAHAAGDIVLVHGRSGGGKSWAAEQYCATHSSAYFVRMTPTVRSLAGMLGRVSDAVGAYGDHRSTQAAEDKVVEQLHGRHALLAIDEAEHLPGRSLEALRCIRDIAGCGLALIGDDTIRMTLGRHPKIVGRIASRLNTAAPREGDVATLLQGVIKRRPTRREIDVALAVARGPGGLHALRRALERAWMAASIAGRDRVEIADLEAAGREAASLEDVVDKKGRAA